MRIKFVSVPVSDQDRAKKFYADALGFTVSADIQGDGGRFIDLVPPAGGCGIALVTNMPAGSLKGLVLDVDDIDATHALLAAAGVTFTSTPRDTAHGRFASFEDPDGNGWVLMTTSS
jgi:catechol 2,3-dioxygenase-like lactoylglutathione lyase family enzyme